MRRLLGRLLALLRRGREVPEEERPTHTEHVQGRISHDV